MVTLEFIHMLLMQLLQKKPEMLKIHIEVQNVNLEIKPNGLMLNIMN